MPREATVLEPGMLLGIVRFHDRGDVSGAIDGRTVGVGTARRAVVAS